MHSVVPSSLREESIVVVVQDAGAEPLQRSPRGERPYSLHIFVFAEDSSMKTRRVASTVFCQHAQSIRAF